MMGFEAVEALGITVVPITTLKDAAVIVENQNVLLVREDLDSVKRDEVVDWILKERGQADVVKGVWHAEHMLNCLNNLRKRPPIFHVTAAGLISTWPDVTLPLGTDTGPGIPQPSLCGLHLRDVYLRGDNPIVLDVLGDVRVCKRCTAAHAKAQEAGR